MKYQLSTFAVVGAITLLSFQSCNNASESSAQADLPPIEVSAVKLLADYEADEPAAEKVYGGRNLSVFGQVMSITKKHDGKVEILLNSQESSIGSVRCHFSAEEAAKLANIQREDSILVKGVCANMDSHVQVVVKDCKLGTAPVAGKVNIEATATVVFKKKDPANNKALKAVKAHTKVIDALITDAGVLYVTDIDEGKPMDSFLSELRNILQEHKCTVRWIKLVDWNTADANNKEEPYGKVFAELKW
jgi:hypothetical protein